MKKTSERLEQHKKVVSFLRWLFMVLACVVTLVIFIWPQVVRQRTFLKEFLKAADIEYNPISSMNMAKVSFSSQDEKGQPFILTASKVTEIDPEKKLVQLDDPRGVSHQNSGKDVSFTSTYAYYYQKDDLVHFLEDALVETSDGYTGKLSDVRLNYKKETAESRRPINVSGPELTLKAQGFKSRQNGDEIDFLGSSYLKLLSLKDDKTIEITSKNGMQLRQKDQTFTALKDVVITEERNKIYSDKAVAFYEKDDQGKFVLKTLNADGNVQIKTLSETVTGKEAVYDADRQEMTVTGDVQIVRSSGTINGQKAIVNMNTGISRMFAQPSKDDKNPTRIKGIFLPSEMKKDKMTEKNGK